MSDIDEARGALAAIRFGFATSSQDWSKAPDGVYLNGIAGSGWEPDPDDPDSTNVLHDQVVKVGGSKGWGEETTAHIRKMRAGFLSLTGLLDELEEARRRLAAIDAGNAALAEFNVSIFQGRRIDLSHGPCDVYSCLFPELPTSTVTMLQLNEEVIRHLGRTHADAATAAAPRATCGPECSEQHTYTYRCALWFATVEEEWVRPDAAERLNLVAAPQLAESKPTAATPYPPGDPRGLPEYQDCWTDMCAAQRQHVRSCKSAEPLAVATSDPADTKPLPSPFELHLPAGCDPEPVNVEDPADLAISTRGLCPVGAWKDGDGVHSPEWWACGICTHCGADGDAPVADDGACPRCGGLDGTHLFRDCPNAPGAAVESVRRLLNGIAGSGQGTEWTDPCCSGHNWNDLCSFARFKRNACCGNCPDWENVK